MVLWASSVGRAFDSGFQRQVITPNKDIVGQMPVFGSSGGAAPFIDGQYPALKGREPKLQACTGLSVLVMVDAF